MRLKDIELPEAVVAGARAGERSAQAAFYAACAKPAYTLIRRLVPGPAADDLLHEAFIDAFRGLPRYAGTAPLAIWFRSVVVHRCFQHLRSPWQRSRGLIDDALEALAADDAAEPGLSVDLGRALEQLPALARLVVWLHDVEGYTHEEIAAATGRSVSFSKSQLSRARGRLRLALGADGTGEAAAVASLGSLPSGGTCHD
jgi:RNA polymerase sigma-70 factor (ECF subfamily)